MRILVASARAPFAPASSDARAATLVAALRAHRPTDLVDVVSLPDGPGASLAASLSDVTAGVDRLVALDDVAARLPHPRVRRWTDAAPPGSPDGPDWGRLVAELVA